MHAGNHPTHKIVIDMLRHGEPEGGVMYRGSKDDPLSDLGWQQMRSTLKNVLALDYKWDKIISSPLKRCQAFATEAAQKLNLQLDIIDDLQELNFGDLEGLRPKDAWKQHPELLKNLWQDPINHTPPNGEPFSDFTQRVCGAMENLIHQNTNRHVLLVVHGGVVRAALHNLLRIPPSSTFQFDIPYASLTRFQVYLNEDKTFETALSFVNGIPKESNS